MSKGAYYNEFDPFKAEVLREAIKAGAIAPGDVDERSIADVRGEDLRGYTQCHFFAGGGFWSLALRNAGWGDDRPVWTGSCPCPSFSAAGKGAGFADPRHLWPHWFRLIRECRPSIVLGEQVSAAIGHGWLDLVQDDLEAETYAVGKAVLGACSVGAPHIRQRLWFVAESAGIGHVRGWAGYEGNSENAPERRSAVIEPERSRDVGILGDAPLGGLGIAGSAPGSAGHADLADESLRMGIAIREGVEGHGGDGGDGNEPGRLGEEQTRPATETGESGGVADVRGIGRGRREGATQGHESDGEDAGRIEGDGGPECGDKDAGRMADTQCDGGWPDFQERGAEGRASDGWDCEALRPNPLNGFWRDADWIGCRDGKFRPVEPKYVKMAHGGSGAVVPVCDHGAIEPQEEEKIDAIDTKTGPDSALRFLRQTSAPEALEERNSGGYDRLQETPLLQPALHGERPRRSHQKAQRQEQSAAVGKDGREIVSSMREDAMQTARPPQRREPAEQRAGEFGDFMRQLPQSLALAQLHGDAATKEALLALLEASGASGLLQHPFIAQKEVWRSLTQEVQNRLRMGFEEGGFVRKFESPLGHKCPARVGRLRMYGDGIVVPVAQAFIESVMEVL